MTYVPKPKKKPRKKKPAKFVIRQKKNFCSYCGSKRIEPSWGAEGYMQCNKCGREFRK